MTPSFLITYRTAYRQVIAWPAGNWCGPVTTGSYLVPYLAECYQYRPDRSGA